MPGDRRQILSLLRLPIPPLQLNGQTIMARALTGSQRRTFAARIPGAAWAGW